MKTNYFAAAEETIKRLQNSNYITFIDKIDVEGIPSGLRLEGIRTEDYIVFINNLSLTRPSKKEAIAMLEAMVEHYERLRNANPDFQKFVGNRKFAAELVVFSGHMDFKVAIWEDGEIEWESELD
jgi:hypothetical protein